MAVFNTASGPNIIARFQALLMKKRKIAIGLTCCTNCHTCHTFFAEAIVHYLRLHPDAALWQVPLVFTTYS